METINKMTIRMGERTKGTSEDMREKGGSGGEDKNDGN